MTETKFNIGNEEFGITFRCDANSLHIDLVEPLVALVSIAASLSGADIHMYIPETTEDFIGSEFEDTGIGKELNLKLKELGDLILSKCREIRRLTSEYSGEEFNPADRLAASLDILCKTPEEKSNLLRSRPNEFDNETLLTIMGQGRIPEVADYLEILVSQMEASQEK